MKLKIMGIVSLLLMAVCSFPIISNPYSTTHILAKEIHLGSEINTIINADHEFYLKKNISQNTIELYNLNEKKLWNTEVYNVDNILEGICLEDGSAIVRFNEKIIQFDNKGNCLWSYNFDSRGNIHFLPLDNGEIIVIHNIIDREVSCNYSGISFYKINNIGEIVLEKHLENSKNINIEKAEYQKEYGLFISGIAYSPHEYFDGKFIASVNTDTLDINWKKSADDLSAATFYPDFVLADEHLFLIKNVHVDQKDNLPDLMLPSAYLSKLDLEGNEIFHIDLRTLDIFGNIRYLSADNLKAFNNGLIFTANPIPYDISQDTQYMISVDFNGNCRNLNPNISQYIQKIIPTTEDSIYILEKHISKVLELESPYSSYKPLDTYVQITEYDADFNLLKQLKYDDFQDTDKEDILFILPNGTIISY